METLTKTWFSPWKNDVQSARNIALSDQVKLWEQNIASRIFGFLLRSIIILVSLLFIGVASAAGLLFLLLWILSPVLIIILPILALML